MNLIPNIYVASLVMVFAAFLATPVASSSDSSSMMKLGDSCSSTGLININLFSTCCGNASCCVNFGFSFFNCGNKNNLLNDTTGGILGGAVSNVLNGACGSGDQAVCAGEDAQCFNIIPVTTSAVGVVEHDCCTSTGAGDIVNCGNNVNCNQQNADGSYLSCCNSNCAS